MRRPLVILGTGGSAYDVLDVVEAINAAAPTWEVVGFLDDARPPGTRHLGLEVLGPLREAARFADAPSSTRSAATRASATSRRSWPRPAWRPNGSRRSSTRPPRSHRVLGWAVASSSTTASPSAAECGSATTSPSARDASSATTRRSATIRSWPRAPSSAGSSTWSRPATSGRGPSSASNSGSARRSLIGMGAVVVRDVEPGATLIGNPARPLRRVI